MIKQRLLQTLIESYGGIEPLIDEIEQLMEAGWGGYYDNRTISQQNDERDNFEDGGVTSMRNQSKPQPSPSSSKPSTPQSYGPNRTMAGVVAGLSQAGQQKVKALQDDATKRRAGVTQSSAPQNTAGGTSAIKTPAKQSMPQRATQALNRTTGRTGVGTGAKPQGARKPAKPSTQPASKPATQDGKIYGNIQDHGTPKGGYEWKWPWEENNGKIYGNIQDHGTPKGGY